MCVSSLINNGRFFLVFLYKALYLVGVVGDAFLA